jgi:hypothetical protein
VSGKSGESAPSINPLKFLLDLTPRYRPQSLERGRTFQPLIEGGDLAVMGLKRLLIFLWMAFQMKVGAQRPRAGK